MKGERGFAGDAAFTADQPADICRKNSRTSDLECRRDFHVDGVENFVGIAEVHQWPERQALGRGILHRTGGDSLRQLPFDRWRFAGIAGIDPVDMPVVIEDEVQARLKAGAGSDGCRGGDERDLKVGCGGRGTVRGDGARGELCMRWTRRRKHINRQQEDQEDMLFRRPGDCDHQPEFTAVLRLRWELADAEIGSHSSFLDLASIFW